MQTIQKNGLHVMVQRMQGGSRWKPGEAYYWIGCSQSGVEHQDDGRICAKFYHRREKPVICMEAVSGEMNLADKSKHTYKVHESTLAIPCSTKNEAIEQVMAPYGKHFGH